MPIKSYLAHPEEGKKEELIKAISQIKQCEVIPAENKNVLVVITETEDETQEIILTKKLESIQSLKLLALVSGFNSPKNN
jgi:nitrate reductase NapAB chaperone NapD